MEFSKCAFVFVGSIPYPDPGTIIPGSTTAVANGGEIDAYFVSYNPGDDDLLYLVDLDTANRVGPTFPNKTTAQGTFETLGTYTAGTNLAFEILDLTINQTFSSDTALSDDGVNHVYITDSSGGPIANG
jgi:hypothetical protein